MKKATDLLVIFLKKENKNKTKEAHSVTVNISSISLASNGTILTIIFSATNATKSNTAAANEKFIF